MAGQLLASIDGCRGGTSAVAAYPPTAVLTPGVGCRGSRGRPVGRMTERDDLPLPDYDHLPVGS